VTRPGYVISLEQPPIDRETVLSLASGLPGYSEARYEKYYRRSPVGAPLLAVMREEESGEAVGMAALFPVRLRIGEETMKGAIAGDFVIARAQRTLGPALGMQRLLLSSLADAGLDFVLAAPNSLAEPVFLRAGYELLRPQSRFVKILHLRPLLATRLPAKLARLISWLADPLLLADTKLRFRFESGRYSLERPERFDERFCDVWRHASSRGEVLVDRNAELLNWKYELDGPAASGRFHILALSEERSIAAYLVYEQSGDVMHVYDALWRDSALETLLVGLVRVARTRASAIVFSCFDSGGELARSLRRCGFSRHRPASKLLLHIAPHSARARVHLGNGNWYFLQGDLDL
jgi:hypothetical protein